MLKNGLIKFSVRDQYRGGIGKIYTATFQTFEEAFHALARGSQIQGVHIIGRWIPNWTWIASDNSDKAFFEAMGNTLDDDCIRELNKHLDLPHLVYFAHIDDRFKAIAAEKKRLRIFPSVVGSINLMDLRYLLHMFGSSITELSISLNTFPSTFGHYFDHTKRFILRIISDYTGPQIKKIGLYDFVFNENEKKDFECFFDMFIKRGIELKFN